MVRRDECPETLVQVRYYGAAAIPETSGWYGLYSELERVGFKVTKNLDNSIPTHLVVIDYVARDEAQWPRVKVSNRLLIASECVVVNPLQFTKRVVHKFDQVIVPSGYYPPIENGTVWENGGFYLSTRYKQLLPNNGTRQGCALVNENKFSHVKSSNYILRSTVIKKMIERGLPIEVGGRNWTRGLLWTFAKLVHHFLIALRAGRADAGIRPALSAISFSLSRRRVARVAVGVVPDSVEFLSRYKVAIVIENEASYVSEKLHAAFVAGCQCVYVGPPLKSEDFPAGFLFQAGPKVEAVLASVEKALRTPYAISASQLKEVLQTSEFFARENVDLRNDWIASFLRGWALDRDL